MDARATILSLRTGRVRDHVLPSWDARAGQVWRTAYVKDEAPGPLHAGRLGFAGDEQAHPDVHGGPYMAVLAYAAAHYARWREETGLAAMGPGGFGENLALDGPDEHGVCIGDVWAADHAGFTVTQPRGPCAAISRIWDVPDLMQRAVASCRIGWYLGVRHEGPVTRGEALRLVERPHPEWTVARVFALRIGADRDAGALAALAGCEALSPEWRGHITGRLAK